MERFLNLRYNGTDVAVMIQCLDNGDYQTPFTEHYKREFGFVLDRAVMIDDVRVRAIGRTQRMVEKAQSTNDPGMLKSTGRQHSPWYLSISARKLKRS